MPRSAPAQHPAHPGVQADQVGGRLLARQREEPAAAADLRHRVGEPGRAQGLPAAAGRGREARPPQARRRARPLLVPGRDRVRPGGVPPQGRGDQAGDGGLRPAAAHRGGLLLRRDPAHLQGGALPPLRPPALLRRRDVPAHPHGGRGLLPQGHELPDAQPDLPVPWAVLPRAAAAVLRVRLGVPEREVRRGARPDQGPRHDPGRLALLRHSRAGAGRDQAPAGLLPEPVQGLRAGRLLPRAVDPRRGLLEVRGLGRGLGHRHRRTGEGRHRLRAGAGARPGRRRVLRAEDLGAVPGRHRPHLADVDDPVRLQPAGRLPAWSTRRPTARASSR